MIRVPDICDAALEAERAAQPTCAAHRTRLLDAAVKQRPAPAAGPLDPSAAHRGRLARAVRLLRQILRPASA